MTVNELIEKLSEYPADANITFVEEVIDNEELLCNVTEVDSFYCIELSNDVVILK